MCSSDLLYLIEDTHTSYWVPFEGGVRRKGAAIEFAKDKIDDMHRHYFQQGFNVPDKMGDIESVEFFDSIIAISKRLQKPRRSVAIPWPPKF